MTKRYQEALVFGVSGAYSPKSMCQTEYFGKKGKKPTQYNW